MLPNFLLKRASITPERPAIHFNGITYSFREVYDRAYKVAGQLTFYGLKEKQFVGVLLQNHFDTAVIYLAFQLIGVRAVILNNRLTADELMWQLNDCQAAFLVTESAFSGKSIEIKSTLLHIKIIEKEALFEADFSEPTIITEVDLDEVCTVMYTSGTTGHPKGVLQTYGNHWWSAIGSALNLGLNENDSWLCTVPMFHISGYSILMRSIIYGMKMVIHESFHELKAIEAIRSEKVTIMSVVGTMLTRMEKELNKDNLPAEFRCMLLGGGPASKSLLEKCHAKNIPVYQTYGMTETSSQIVTLSPEYSFSKLGSAGKPLFPSQLKIIDSNGEMAEEHVVGEIVVKGPNVTCGYLHREEETAQKLVDGWLYTGDIGYLDEEGFLYVLDRRSDLIISGGENIYPAEIEGVLMSHSSVLDAGVIGMKDERWGEVPVAFIVMKNNISNEEIIHYCQQKLAKYKIPKEIIPIDEIPRNAAKKILRRELRKLLGETQK